MRNWIAGPAENVMEAPASARRAEDDDDGVSVGRELLNHPNTTSLLVFSVE